MLASTDGECHPQDTHKDDKSEAAGMGDAALHGKLRRSWYSQTFSDDECDDEEERSLLTLASAGAAGVSQPAPETCRAQEDNNSDASTDVGSDDECAKLDDFDVDEARSRPCSTTASSHDDIGIRHSLTPEERSDKDPAALKQSQNPEETEALSERRLLKRQRQREERREQRVNDRAERSAARWKRPQSKR